MASGVDVVMTACRWDSDAADYLIDDGLHLSASGHRAYALAVSMVLA